MYIDTKRIRDCKSNLDSYIENLNTIYTSLFENLENLENNKVWTGEVSKLYINSVKKERRTFETYISDLKKYSAYLENVIVDYERKLSI